MKDIKSFSIDQPMMSYNISRELPKGIYIRNNNYRVLAWDADGKTYTIGTVPTLKEAMYIKRIAMSTNHWVGVEPEPDKYGFIYAVIDRREKTVYFGRKVYQNYNKATGERSIDSGWEFYSTGSANVQKIYNERPWDLTFEILMNVDSNDEASYVEWLLISEFMNTKLPTGEPKCLNLMLPKLFSNGLDSAVESVGNKANEIVRRFK